MRSAVAGLLSRRGTKADDRLDDGGGGGARADTKYDYAAAPPKLVQRARAIAAVCERHGTTLPAAALNFPLSHPSVLSVCVGARSAGQLERNAALFDKPIPSDLWSELKAERLVREDAPTPV